MARMVQRIGEVVVATLVVTGCPGDGGGTTGTTGTTATSSTGAQSTTGPSSSGGSAATTTGSETGVATTGGSTTGEAPTCACLIGFDNLGCGEVELPSLAPCGPALCDEVSSYSNEFSDSLKNPDALICALEALRDRTPGVIRWKNDADPDSTAYGGLGFTVIHADGTAVMGEWYWNFRCCGGNRITHDTLKDPAEFTKCLNSSDTWTRLHCVKDPVKGITIEVCEEGDICF